MAGNVLAMPSDTLEVLVKGSGSDARFEPVVLLVQPGDVVKFEVVEGLHTVTAYHPENRRPLRIPGNAASFNSGMLTIGDVWLLKLEEKGMYDYFCLPHERMGHAGRIIVGELDKTPDYPVARIPSAILGMLQRETEELLAVQ